MHGDVDLCERHAEHAEERETSHGRLDADHSPAAVVGKPADLETLRKIFPGF